MRTYEEAAQAAKQGRAFPNGTSYEAWRERWCDRCAHDTDALVDAGHGCPLVLLAMLEDKTPAEWQPVGHAYRCGEFINVRDVKAPARREPHEEIPGQEALVTVEECGARRGS